MCASLCFASENAAKARVGVDGCFTFGLELIPATEPAQRAPPERNRQRERECLLYITLGGGWGGAAILLVIVFEKGPNIIPGAIVLPRSYKVCLYVYILMYSAYRLAKYIAMCFSTFITLNMLQKFTSIRRAHRIGILRVRMTDDVRGAADDVPRLCIYKYSLYIYVYCARYIGSHWFDCGNYALG